MQLKGPFFSLILFASNLVPMVSCIGFPPINDEVIKEHQEHKHEQRSNSDEIEKLPFGLSCGDGSGMRLEVPLRSYQGPTGPRGEQGSNGRPGLPGLPGLSAPNTCQVAFYAALATTHDYSYYNDGDPPLIFDRVITNKGNAYDILTGHFTAPFNGTYLFQVNVAAKTKKKGAAHLNVNGKFMGTVWAESTNDWGAASNSYILDLKTDDKVYLRVVKRAPHLYAGLYTSFTGMCLWKD